MLKIAPLILESQFLKKIHHIQFPIDNKVPCGSLNAAWRIFTVRGYCPHFDISSRVSGGMPTYLQYCESELC
jgi:hypothetical protein